MPRRSGGGGGARMGGGPARSSSPSMAPGGAHQPHRAPPPPPPPANYQSGGGGMLGNMMSGMAWGVGMSAANRMVDGIVGPREVNVRHQGDPSAGNNAGNNASNQTAGRDPCGNEKEWIAQCLTGPDGKPETCDYYIDLLKRCQQQRGQEL